MPPAPPWHWPVASPRRNASLIEALAARYPQRDPIDDQRPWNDAFADAMRLAHQAHPDDLDVRYIFAEAILNRTPWRMWDLRTGEPAPGAGTLEAREVLETAFRDLPGAMNHPGLLHLHVHLMEMSPHPEAALVTGDRLREVSPDMGHLVHMPTHIDIQCGHYRDAMHWNQKAIVADRKFYDRAGPMNFYSGYRIHNYHFAAYGAMFLGQYAPAIAAADELIETMPEAFLRIPSPPMADFFEAYVADPAARADPFRQMARDHRAGSAGGSATSIATPWRCMHYAKGVAHAALGDVPAAEAEQALFRAAAQRVPESRYIHNVPCVQLLAIAEADAGGRDRLSPRRLRRRRSPISAPPSRWRTTCRTTSPGAGCSRSAMRWVRCCWSKAAWRRPRRCIARISASAARCLARRSTRTMCGHCADCSTAWSSAARPWRRR